MPTEIDVGPRLSEPLWQTRIRAVTSLLVKVAAHGGGVGTDQVRAEVLGHAYHALTLDAPMADFVREVDRGEGRGVSRQASAPGFFWLCFLDSPHDLHDAAGSKALLEVVRRSLDDQVANIAGLARVVSGPRV